MKKLLLILGALICVNITSAQITQVIPQTTLQGLKAATPSITATNPVATLNYLSGNYFPLAGATIAGSIIYNTPGGMALGNTSGNSFNIGSYQSGSIYGKINLDGGNNVANLSASDGANVAQLNLDGTISLLANNGATSTQLYEDSQTSYFTSTYGSYQGLTYAPATATNVAVNQTQYTLLHRAAGDARWLSKSYSVTPTNATAPLSLSSNTISIPAAATAQNGYLTSTDWNTFNNKQAALSVTAPVTLTTNTIALTSIGSGSVVLSTGATLTTPTLGVASATSLGIIGTGGNGYLSLTTQTATPSAPSSGTRIFSNSNSKLSWLGSANGFVKTFDGGLATDDRVYSLPNRNATLDSITTSTSTALNGLLKGTGSLVTTASSTGTNSVVLSTGATITTPTITSGDFSSTTNIFPYAPFQPLYSGAWRTYPLIGVTNSTTSFSGSIFFIPYMVGKTHFATDIGLEVTTAATGSLSLALYSDSSGAPCNLIEASGNLATTGTVTTGIKSYTFTTGTGTGNAQKCDATANQMLWLAVQISSISIGVRYLVQSSGINIRYHVGEGTSLPTWTRGSFSYAAFPSKALGSASANAAPLIGLKVQ